MNKLFVIIDAGHGVDTPGKRSTSGSEEERLYEWEFNRVMQNKLARRLYQAGIQYETIPNSTFDLSLDERVSIVNKLYNRYKEDYIVIVISMHGNAYMTEKPHGIEIYTYPGQTDADDVAEEIGLEFLRKKVFFLRKDESDDDLDKEAKFVILRDTIPPAILVEFGFYTNPKDKKQMQDNRWQEIMVESAFNGIVNWFVNREN